jgi:hypothetical protein
MKNRFVLKGPRAPVERKEGGNSDTNDNVTAPDTMTEPEPAAEDVGIEDTDTQGDSNRTPAGAIDPSLLGIVSQSIQGIDLPAALRGKYQLDPAFQAILAKPNDFRNFEVKEQLVYLKKAGKTVLCIPKVMIQGRSAREIVISEAHSILAHLGASKTLDYLRDHV